MFKTPTLAMLMAAVAFIPTPSSAESLNDSVSAESLAAYCSEAGLGESTATVTMPDGSTLTGEIECEEEDLLVAEADDADEDDDDQGEDGDDEEEDDEGESGDEGDDGEEGEGD